MRISGNTMMRIVLPTCLAFALVATALAQGPGTAVKDTRQKPGRVGPDLTISSVTWRKKPGTAVIVVENIGTVKSASTFGGFRCQSGPSEQGYYIITGTEFHIPALSPNQKKSITLDCPSSVLLDVRLDGAKKVDESNENNNAMTFAEAK